MTPAQPRRGLRDRLLGSSSERVAGAWLRGELATLTRLAETFVDGDAALAVKAAERFDLGLDPSQVHRLRLALWLLELPILGLAFGGSWRPFSRLDQAGRERELRRWATSRLAARRSGYQAFKRVACFLAYADPAPGGVANPRLATIGYEPAREPVTPSPTPIAAFDLPIASGREDAIEIDADVVVIGSGAGGGIAARDLAAAGRSVVVLEAGPLLTEPDMPVDELAAFDRLYLDRGLTATWDGGIAILAGTGVGGGTTINWATCVPPDPELRREWTSRHGIDGFDGAVTDGDLAVLERDLGFEVPPNVPPKDRVLLDGAAALGIEGGTTCRSAAGCGDCGSCPFGCRRGAKRSALRVHLTDAWQRGARVIPDATVRRVLISNEQARGVEADVRGRDGVTRRVRVRAPQVIVAAGALRTPGLLQRSGVVHPALGRFLRLHPVVAAAGLYEQPIEMWRGTMQAARSLEWAPGSAAARAAGHAGFTVESAPGHPGLIAFALPWLGRASFAALMARSRHAAPLIAITRDADWGTVRQTRNGRAQIEYRIGEGAARALRAGAIAAAEILRATEPVAAFVPAEPVAAWSQAELEGLPRADRDWATFRRRLERLEFAPGRTLVFSAHQMGTARMGGVPGVHPVDPDGHVRWAPANVAGGRTIRGLYVADASLLPTAIGTNPMVTVMLLAQRVTRTVLAEGSSAST